MSVDNSQQKRVTFLSKEETKCPICKAGHNREELLSGGGRLIAGKLTMELRREYQESRKFGTIYPLAYSVQVCPQCLYSAYPRDFNRLNDREIEAIRKTTDHRRNLMQTLFGIVNFKETRNLIHGTASMILAVDCYHLRESNIAPTLKKAVTSIRAAWLLGDLFGRADYRPYDKIADFYYMEAVKNYRATLDNMQNRSEPVEAEGYIMGPDLDKNWGFDGIIYLNAYLTMKYIDRMASDNAQRKEYLEKAKRYLSKLYGSGKASKDKPSAIVDMAKDVYDQIGDMISKL